MTERGNTRERLVRTAERLFGEHGIGAVSLRQIAVEAGQRNHSAVAYQFGSREGLVDAIFVYRMARIDERRRAMMSAAGIGSPAGAGSGSPAGSGPAGLGPTGSGPAGSDPGAGARPLLEALIYPLAESIGHDDGVSWYARFLRQVVFLPGFEPFAPARADVTRGLRAVWEGLGRHTYHLGPPLQTRRLLQISQITVHTLADHEAALALGDRSIGTSLLAADLVDCTEAVLIAPVSTDTQRELTSTKQKGA